MINTYNKEYHQEYYQRNKSKISKRCKERYYSNLESEHKRRRDYYVKNREVSLYKTKVYRNSLRDMIFELLGNKCTKCPFSDKRALQIDHINGGGSQERKIYKSPVAFYHKVINKPSDYQLLCANCNMIKKHENKEYGGGRRPNYA
jgi:hypothetical protein